jgi:hypothetical protein
MTLFLLILSTVFAAPMSGQSKNIPWGGWWWPMITGETALGWKDDEGRKEWKPAEVKKFNKCLSLESSEFCVSLLSKFKKNKGIELSPLMKFDLYVANKLANEASDYDSDDFTTSASHELKIHYINSNSHPHYPFKDFAGKCIGWSLSSINHKEPTEAKEIMGVLFKPADIKAILATAYTAAIMFVPDSNFVGTTYLSGGAISSEEDVYPHQLLKTLIKVIGNEKKSIVADLQSNEEVWNYPIYGYKINLENEKNGKVKGHVDLKFISDDVEKDAVFSTLSTSKRTDLLEQNYTFELTVPNGWSGDFTQIKKSKWLGDSIAEHPDTLITGLENDWMDIVYEDYIDDEDMAQEANLELFKRSMEDEINYLGDLLKDYF